MKRFFKIIKKIFLKLVDIQIRILLFLTYFLIFTPLSVFLKFFCDYLEIGKPPGYTLRNKIENLEEFLKRQ